MLESQIHSTSFEITGCRAKPEFPHLQFHLNPSFGENLR